VAKPSAVAISDDSLDVLEVVLKDKTPRRLRVTGTPMDVEQIQQGLAIELAKGENLTTGLRRMAARYRGQYQPTGVAQSVSNDELPRLNAYLQGKGWFDMIFVGGTFMAAGPGPGFSGKGTNLREALLGCEQNVPN
jgi:hypothetical protein